MNERKQIKRIFMASRDNAFVSYTDAKFVQIISHTIIRKEHIGYIIFSKVPKNMELCKKIKFNQNLLLVMHKGKLSKINTDHKVDGMILKQVLGNIFVNPIAVISDININKTHKAPTYNFISKVTNGKKPYYAIIEVNSNAQNGVTIEANVIKTIFDKSKVDNYLRKIEQKEKAGLNLLYLE